MDFSERVTTFSTERLQTYLDQPQRFERYAVVAAIAELRRRGVAIDPRKEAEVQSKLKERDDKKQREFEKSDTGAIFKRAETGIRLLREANRILNAHDKLAVPLVFSWIVYGSLIIYFGYYFPWEALTTNQSLLVSGAIFLCFSFLFGTANLVLLEMVEQLESGRPAILGRAIRDTFRHNLLKAAPILSLWALLWFLLTILQVFFASRRKDSETAKDRSMENFAKSLSGLEGSWSFAKMGLTALSKGIRMLVFLILPAVAWEQKSSLAAIRRGAIVLRTHFVEFGSTYVLTEAVAFLFLFPLGLLFTALDKFSIELPEYLWSIVILYIGGTWVYVAFLEQIMTAQLYLWHLKWEKHVSQIPTSSQPLPWLRSVEPPSLVDDIAEFAVLRGTPANAPSRNGAT